MTDFDPDIPDRPVVVAESPVGIQSATLARDFLIVVSIIPALAAVFGTHDLNQIVAFLTGPQFAPALGVITLTATVAWRQWIVRRQHSNDVKMASAAPDSIAVVKRSVASGN